MFTTAVTMLSIMCVSVIITVNSAYRRRKDNL
jgi:hypothetical protein